MARQVPTYKTGYSADEYVPNKNSIYDDINKIEEAIYSQHSIQIENLNQIPRDTMTIVNCPRITISTK